ncbi:hypothetical protein COU62_00725 [Candidatus Pacearchaeota archaeon CG10_big_fil_rev_8_21_14_0_10_35_219]|nr:hypothetical protein [Candidatus Pacearchaeota archaeon]OIO42744.1 MAG: hypothetical protein AUJ63_01865 [Candidatus Pacearchaeota archaeon CG1_02_35_32]PIO08210.1 MAG: hypothetical protein COU62_00725 [Candidatus Pacearchaeota archaeon CG10_big_fil_rev_8_21_14_0_10_35_219]PIY81720.1 MAG: hypothetical protein COY79_01020 [Candidatus Pacearchaeota archaeon CG_4_10_14_0_8_um_filter_35_169]PIZ80376.1 MAG: hypothetical protein COY00_01475 [Candidatus Pacearchaeota archaeon CG_4_10_14_0_2_um_filt
MVFQNQLYGLRKYCVRGSEIVGLRCTDDRSVERVVEARTPGEAREYARHHGMCRVRVRLLREDED